MTFFLAFLACPKTVEPPVAAVAAPHPLDVRPEIGAPADFAPQAPQVFTLDNGTTVWLVERPGLPLVSVRMVLGGGKAMDPADQPGLVNFSDTMLTHGAGDLNSTAFAGALEQHALSLWANSGQATTWVGLEATTDTLEVGLDLMASAVSAPRFDAEEVDRVRDRLIGEVQMSLDSPATVARWVADSFYFGEDHPLAHPGIGNQTSLTSITAKDLKSSWSARFAPERATFVVSGDVTQVDLKAQLEDSFGDWTGKPSPLPEIGPAAQASGYYLVDNPGATQSVLRVVLPGWQADDPHYVSATLGSVVLGGTFTSRVNRLLREEKGYSYGARAGVGAGPGYGRMVTSSSVRGDVTALALVDMLAEVERITQGIDAAELKKAQGAAITDAVSAMESRSSIAASLAGVVAMGQSPDRMAMELQTARNASVSTVNAAMATLDTDAALIVVVGDLSVIQPQLADVLPDVNWTVVEK